MTTDWIKRLIGSEYEVGFIVSNIPRSARVWELWELLSEYSDLLSDVDIHASSTTKAPWARVTLRSSSASAGENGEPEFNGQQAVELDDRYVTRLLTQLNGLVWRGKRLRARRP